MLNRFQFDSGVDNARFNGDVVNFVKKSKYLYEKVG